jgi:hypothetical protein
MRAKIGLALLSALVSLLLPTALAAQEEIPPMPLIFQGTVSIDGEPAPVGTNISAEIEEVEVAGPEGITEAGNYTISIESDDNIGKIVVFKVNGVVAGQHEYVDPWETPTVALNLSTGSAPPTSGGLSTTWIIAIIVIIAVGVVVAFIIRARRRQS